MLFILSANISTSGDESILEISSFNCFWKSPVVFVNFRELAISRGLSFNNNQRWKKKNAEGCFDVTMGSYDGAEICELVEIYILSRLSTIIDKNDCGLYRDNRLLVLRNVNGQQIDRVRKMLFNYLRTLVFSKISKLI